MGSSSLAVLRHVTFRGRTTVRIPADPPRDTRDPRAVMCTEHRTACDCREADLGEALAEARYEAMNADRAQKHLRSITRLHSAHSRRWSTGPGCRGCLEPWPCSTWSLAMGGLSEWERHFVQRESEAPF